jgi:DNA-binding SARP family transcriptional activator
VSLDRLIDYLWPQRAPARAGATVQVFVPNLRRMLELERPRDTGGGADDAGTGLFAQSGA